MNSHAPAILELPAPKEVSILWDLNLSAASSSQDYSRSTRTRHRQLATNTPSYRCCPGSLLPSSARCASLPVHRSGPALKSVSLKIEVPMVLTTVWYLMKPWAPDRGSLIAPIPRTGQHCQCSKLLPLNAISRLCTRERQREREREREKI